MKVLLIGATGNLGLRLVPALLTHNHIVVAFVRSARKLESLLPSSAYDQISVVEGDAQSSKAIKNAILENGCDAVVNTAGVAALAPWGSSDQPKIFRAVVEAVVEAGKDRKPALRTWFLGGMGVLYYPGSKTMLSDYIPIYLTHRANLSLLRSLPGESLDWSMLCPMTMVPESDTLSNPSKPIRGQLISTVNTPPNFQDSWVKHIPLIGRALHLGINAGRYETSLEQNAELIAEELANRNMKWINVAVGVIDPVK